MPAYMGQDRRKEKGCSRPLRLLLVTHEMESLLMRLRCRRLERIARQCLSQYRSHRQSHCCRRLLLCLGNFVGPVLTVNCARAPRQQLSCAISPRVCFSAGTNEVKLDRVCSLQNSPVFLALSPLALSPPLAIHHSLSPNPCLFLSHTRTPSLAFCLSDTNTRTHTQVEADLRRGGRAGGCRGGCGGSVGGAGASATGASSLTTNLCTCGVVFSSREVRLVTSRSDAQLVTSTGCAEKG